MKRATVGVSALSALAVGWLAACTPLTAPPLSPLGFPTPGAPPAAAKERRMVTDVAVNACNAESVHLSGALDTETKVHDHSTVEQHVKAHLTGTGSRGNQYTFDLDVQSKWDTNFTTLTLKDRQMLVSKGSAPDQRVTVEIGPSPSFKIEAECHGVPKP